jgi:hypothetical protein
VLQSKRSSISNQRLDPAREDAIASDAKEPCTPRAGEGAVDFPQDHGGPHPVRIEADPEETVAYEELVREIYPKHGFAIREPTHHGRWAGHEKWHTWQDLILANRGPGS